MLLKCKEIKPILAFWMTHKFTQLSLLNMFKRILIALTPPL